MNTKEIEFFPRSMMLGALLALAASIATAAYVDLVLGLSDALMFLAMILVVSGVLLAHSFFVRLELRGVELEGGAVRFNYLHTIVGRSERFRRSDLSIEVKGTGVIIVSSNRERVALIRKVNTQKLDWALLRKYFGVESEVGDDAIGRRLGEARYQFAAVKIRSLMSIVIAVAVLASVLASIILRLEFLILAGLVLRALPAIALIAVLVARNDVLNMRIRDGVMDLRTVIGTLLPGFNRRVDVAAVDFASEHRGIVIRDGNRVLGLIRRGSASEVEWKRLEQDVLLAAAQVEK